MFNVHASGTRGFRYDSGACPDGDMFQMAAIYSALSAGGPSRMGVVSGVADYVLPSASEADGMRAIAGMTFLHLVTEGVDMVAISSNTDRGWIAVSCEKRHLLWPSTTGFARYDFNPGDSPGSEFVHRITPALVSTDFNNYGVLREISNILSRFQDNLTQSDTPMLMIQLWK